MAANKDRPALIPPERVDALRQSLFRGIIEWRSRWRAMVEDLDQQAVIDKIRHDGDWSSRFAFMTCMSAGIAILGLLQNSVAVIIGAMLVAPLMGPIIALGFAIATGDFKWMKECVLTLLGGVMLALFLCVVIVRLSPIDLVTSEIAARTQPTLFDLGVALFSALAGAYAVIRGREGTIIGVAIATALMPPLAVVGFGFATARWTVFGGALLLFVTNFMTIALAAAIMARIYGFSTRLSPQQTRWQSIVIFASFFLLALPLGYSLREIAWEANAQRIARAAVAQHFGDNSRISDLTLDRRAKPLRIEASVLTTATRSGANAALTEKLTEQLGRPVAVAVEQYPLGGSSQLAEMRSDMQELRQAAQQRARDSADIGRDLALLAGVEPSAVTVDADKRRATVRARALPDAGLATYRALELRLAGLRSGWTIELVPPAIALPSVTMDGEEVAEGSKERFAQMLWAAQRTGLKVELAGPGATDLAKWLSDGGADVVVVPGAGAAGGGVQARWRTP